MEKPNESVDIEMEEGLDVIDVDMDGNREVIEISTITAMMCVARFSEKGRQLMESATDEIITDMLNEYKGVRIIY